MKALFKVILLLIIIAAAGAPYGVGMLAEKEYSQMLKQLNTAFAGDLKFIGQFKRGYLVSTATTQVIGADNTPMLSLNHVIQQGPVIINFKGALNPSSYVPRGYKLAVVNTKFDEKTEAFLATVYGPTEAYKIHSEFAFNGSGSTQISLNPLVDYAFFSGVLNWKGLSLNVDNTKNFTKLDMKMLMPLLNYKEGIEATSKEATLSNLNYVHSVEVATLNATASLGIDSATVNAAGANVFTLQKFALTAKDQRAAGLSNSELGVNFSNATIFNDQYGPLALMLKIKNLKTAMLDKFVEDIRPKLEVNLTPEEVQQLLSAHPSLDLDLKFDMPKGKLAVTVVADTNGLDMKEYDPQVVAKAMHAVISVKIDQAIVYQALAQLVENKTRDNEKLYYMNNKTSQVKNPYTLAPDEMQALVEKSVISLLDELKASKLVVEKDKLITTDIKIDKGITTVNGVEKTMDDWNKLQQTIETILPTYKPKPQDPAADAAATQVNKPIVVIPPIPKPVLKQTAPIAPVAPVVPTTKTVPAPATTTTTTTSTTVPDPAANTPVPDEVVETTKP